MASAKSIQFINNDSSNRMSAKTDRIETVPPSIGPKFQNLDLKALASSPGPLGQNIDRRSVTSKVPKEHNINLKSSPFRGPQNQAYDPVILREAASERSGPRRPVTSAGPHNLNLSAPSPAVPRPSRDLDLNLSQEYKSKKKWRSSLSAPIEQVFPSPSPTNPQISWDDEETNETSCCNCPNRLKKGDRESRMSRETHSSANTETQVRFRESSPVYVERKNSALSVPLPRKPSLKIDDSVDGRLIPQYDGSYDDDKTVRKQIHRRSSNNKARDRRINEGFDSSCCKSCMKKQTYDDVDGGGPADAAGSAGGWQGLDRSTLNESSQDPNSTLNTSKGSRDSKSSRKTSITAKTIDAFMRLTFLKILFVDILISAGDLIMDIIQGFNLIFEGVSSPGFYFGIALVASCWVPAFTTPLHLGLNLYKDSLKKKSFIEKVMFIILCSTFYPVIPTILYFCLLLTPRSSTKERRRYREAQRKAHEMKSITAAVEAPIQLTIILYLMFRGIIPLPWNDPMSSSCIKDNLGRTACLPSIPMLSIIFSVLSIMKSMFDLNVKPILANKDCSVSSMNEELLIFMRFLPFSLANIIFRVSSISFILVFFDYWSIIPFSAMLIINLVNFGFSFTRVRVPSAGSRLEKNVDIRLQELESAEIMDPEVPPKWNFEDSHGGPNAPPAPPGGWNEKILAASTPTSEQKKFFSDNPSNPFAQATQGAENTADFHKARSSPPESKYNQIEGTELSSNLFVMSRDLPEEGLPLNSSSRKRAMSFRRAFSRMNSFRSVNSFKPSIINEGNTSIFFNTLSGFFFPSCHSHIVPFVSSQEDTPATARSRSPVSFDEKRIFKWQKTILSRQVVILNSVLLFVVFIVFMLVSYSTFNYNSNIMDSHWFTVVFIVLVFEYLLTMVLAYELKNPVHRLFKSCFPTITGEPDSESSIDLEDARDGGADSKFQSQYSSGGSDEIPRLCRRLWLTVLLASLLALPPLVAVIGGQFGTSSQTYVFIVQDGYSRQELGVLATYTINQVQSKGIIESEISLDCSLDPSQDLTGKILLLNTSRPQCRLLLERQDAVNSTFSKISGLIILDSTPSEDWRVSSPYLPSYSNIDLNRAIPILMVREPDWKQYNQFFLTRGNKISIVGEESLSDVEGIFSCTKQTTLNIGEFLVDDSCLGGKYLVANGSIQENICIKGECSQYGRKCVSPEFKRFEDLRVQLECEASDLTGIDLDFRYREKSLNQPDSLILRPSFENTPGKDTFCCRGQDKNSTFLEVLQDKDQPCFSRWREVEEATARCQWTQWIKSKCNKKTIVMRLCSIQSSCVIKEYYETVGCTDQKVNHCDTNPNRC